MKRTVNEQEFIQAFDQSGRGNQFTYEARKALFAYFEEIESDGAHEFELDVVTVCCEYTEYASLSEFQKDYSDDYKSINDIEDKTTVIRIDEKAFIIAQF